LCTAVQIDSRGEVLSDQPLRWYCIDRLSRQALSECGMFAEKLHSYKTNSMIGLCQEGKGSPGALRTSAGVNCFWFFGARVGPSALVPSSSRTRVPFAVPDQRVVFNGRLSLCSPASLETYQREHRELPLLRPVVLTARPGRPAGRSGAGQHRHVPDQFNLDLG
jgi:hypothetical protein